MDLTNPLLGQICNVVIDYRRGEVPPPSPRHVARWVEQFADSLQEPLLCAILGILEKSYFSERRIRKFFDSIVQSEMIGDEAPVSFWRESNFLHIQRKGSSQTEFLDLFSLILLRRLGFPVEACGGSPSRYIYLDDFIFSGNRIKEDLLRWLDETDSDSGEVHVIVIAAHALGAYFFRRDFEQKCKDLRKSIDLFIWNELSLENRKSYADRSDVLWPSHIPEDECVQNVIEMENKFPFAPRTGESLGQNELFRNNEGRTLLEEQFLVAGARMRARCSNPSTMMKPLGYSPFGLGFGAVVCSYRNCPNNAPLALWWGMPDAGEDSPLSHWYPLLPRRTNSERTERVTSGLIEFSGQYSKSYDRRIHSMVMPDLEHKCTISYPSDRDDQSAFDDEEYL